MPKAVARLLSKGKGWSIERSPNSAGESLVPAGNPSGLTSSVPAWRLRTCTQELWHNCLSNSTLLGL